MKINFKQSHARFNSFRGLAKGALLIHLYFKFRESQIRILAYKCDVVILLAQIILNEEELHYIG